jgi:hypothetical protein
MTIKPSLALCHVSGSLLSLLFSDDHAILLACSLCFYLLAFSDAGMRTLVDFIG